MGALLSLATRQLRVLRGVLPDAQAPFRLEHGAGIHGGHLQDAMFLGDPQPLDGGGGGVIGIGNFHGREPIMRSLGALNGAAFEGYHRRVLEVEACPGTRDSWVLQAGTEAAMRGPEHELTCVPLVYRITETATPYFQTVPRDVAFTLVPIEALNDGRAVDLAEWVARACPTLPPYSAGIVVALQASTLRVADVHAPVIYVCVHAPTIGYMHAGHAEIGRVCEYGDAVGHVARWGGHVSLTTPYVPWRAPSAAAAAAAAV